MQMIFSSFPSFPSVKNQSRPAMSLGEFLIVLSLLLVGLAIMAVYLAARNYGWFSLCPQIDDDGERLVAHTARLPWLLSLTLLYRSVDGR
jgi:hypothetical protein